MVERKGSSLGNRAKLGQRSRSPLKRGLHYPLQGSSRGVGHNVPAGPQYRFSFLLRTRLGHPIVIPQGPRALPEPSSEADSSRRQNSRHSAIQKFQPEQAPQRPGWNHGRGRTPPRASCPRRETGPRSHKPSPASRWSFDCEIASTTSPPESFDVSIGDVAISDQGLRPGWSYTGAGQENKPKPDSGRHRRSPPAI